MIDRIAMKQDTDAWRASMVRSIRGVWTLYATVIVLADVMLVASPWRIGWSAVPACCWLTFWCAWAGFWVWFAPKLRTMGGRS